MKKIARLSLLLLIPTLTLAGCSAGTVSEGAPAAPESSIIEPDSTELPETPQIEEGIQNATIDPNAVILSPAQQTLEVEVSGSYSLTIPLGAQRTFKLAEEADLIGWTAEISPEGVAAYIPSESQEEGSRSGALVIAVSPGTAVITLTSPTNPEDKITIGVTVVSDDAENKLLIEARVLAIELVGLTTKEAFEKITENGNPQISGYVSVEDGVPAEALSEYSPGIIQMEIVDGKVSTAGIG